MQPKGQDLFECPRRSVGVIDCIFYGPGPPSSSVEPSANGERRILMPNDKPIRFRRLIKKCRPEWECRIPENGPGNGQHPRTVGKLCHRSMPHQVPNSSAAPAKGVAV